MRFPVFLFLAILLTPAAAGEVQPLAVVVAPPASIQATNLAELSLIYRRKHLMWPGGSRIYPANLPTDHPLRRHFSQVVLSSSPEGLAQYWNALYFHGISPPYVLASDEAVLRFVAETPGAIGYVSACKVDNRVRPVLWISPSGGVSDTPPELGCPQD